jgi:transposase InsO family protein
MGAIVRLLLAAARSFFLPRSRLQIEILLLRHQLSVLRRTAPRRPRLSNGDRLLLVWLSQLWPGVLRSLTILRPETVVRWHRMGWRAYWRWRSRAQPGRPKLAAEIRALVREISLANPLWGAPHVHGELMKLGVEVAQSTVSKYMARERRPPGQSWSTFLRNHADGIASIDLLVVPTITFKMLYAFVVLRHERRQLILIGVTAHPTAEWLARQISETFPWDTAPRYLVRDRDRAYGRAFRRRLRSMGIRDRPTTPGSPWQNPFVERLIGSIRRECLDHLVVVNEAHLRRALISYAGYYNGARTHIALEKDTPLGRTIQRVGRVIRIPHLGGMHHTFARI